MSLKSFGENLLVAGFFMSIFLPVRIIFFTYVSDHWLGSAGLLTAIMLTILYLAQKNKLGYIGRLIIRKINKIKNSKKFFIPLIINSVLLSVMVVMIIGMTSGDGTPLSIDLTEHLAQDGINNYEDLAERAETTEFTPISVIQSIVFLIILPFVAFDLYASIMSVLDDLTDHWIQHFIIVSIIEGIEALGLLVYFRFKTLTEPDSNT